MIHWPIVLSAFCAGMALAFSLAARESRRNSPSTATARLLSGLSLTTALVTIGLIVLAASHSIGVFLGTPTQSPSSFVTRSGHSSFVIPSTKQFPFLPPSSFLPTPSSIDSLPRLQIPSLNVDEPIETIPIRDGQWDLTTLGTGIGWLTTTGAHPGDEWAMVFIGHMTLSGTERGPFAYLQKIQKNAEVIYQAAGENYAYRVETISRAGPEDVKRLYLADGDRLLLVTCTDWDATQRIYTNRLLVQARLEERSIGNQ